MIRRGETKGEHLEIPLDRITPTASPSFPGFIKRHPKSTGDPCDRWWTLYRVGGHPVDFNFIDLISLLATRGIRVGGARNYKGGARWRCSCPWAQEHSGGIDDDSAVVIQTPGNWPSFHCSHSHHSHLGLKDVIEFIWGRP